MIYIIFERKMDTNVNAFGRTVRWAISEQTEGGMKLTRYKTRGLCRGKSLLAGMLVVEQVFPNQNLHHFVPVDLADHAAGVVVVGDVGWVLGQKVTYNLIDGVIALFGQGIKHTPENTAHVLFVVTGYGKFQGVFFRHGLSLLW